MTTIEDVERIIEKSKGLLPDPDVEKAIQKIEDSSLSSPGVHAHYYRFFYHFASILKPKLIVELGTYYGHSSLCLASGNPEGRVITVDHKERVYLECVRENIDYRIHDSLVPVGDEKIDLLFIDTLHDGVRALNEFNLYRKRMNSDSIVFFDDISLNDNMKNFWRNFNPYESKYELDLHGWAGFGAVIINERK